LVEASEAVALAEASEAVEASKRLCF